MFARSFRTGLAVTALVTAGLTLGSAGTALAEPAPTDPTPAAADFVAVGSDTTQIVMQKLADAYNATSDSATHKLYSFDACIQGVSTCVTGGNITIRSGGGAGTVIARPNGSGQGKTLLYGTAVPTGAPTDSGNTYVTFARSSAGLNTTESGKSLQAFPFAVDTLVSVTKASGSNAPESLSIDQLLGIYDGTFTNWSQLGGQPGVIKAYLPQTGSGTRNFFVDQLTAANGGNVPSIAPSVAPMQEHSPELIKDDPNAVAPYSRGRADSSVRIETGWQQQRAVYNVVRNADSASTAPVVASLLGPDGYLCSAAARSIIEANGFQQLKTRGSGGGDCGNYTNTSTSNLAAYNQLPALVSTSTQVTLNPSIQAYGAGSSVSVNVTGTTAPVNGYVTVSTRGFVGSAKVVAGAATVPLPANLPAGTYPIKALYSGSTTYSGSVNRNTLVITKTAGSTSAAFPASVKKKKAATGTIRVSAPGVVPTGSVTVSKNGAVVGSYPLAGGTATVTLPKQKKAKGKKGKKPIVFTVTYPGDANVTASSTTFQLKQK